MYVHNYIIQCVYIYVRCIYMYSIYTYILKNFQGFFFSLLHMRFKIKSIVFYLSITDMFYIKEQAYL